MKVGVTDPDYRRIPQQKNGRRLLSAAARWDRCRFPLRTYLPAVFSAAGSMMRRFVEKK